MIEINLIPDVKRELLRAQNIRAKVITGSIIIGVSSIAVVAFLVIYVFTFQSIRNDQADKEINTLGTQLSKVADLSKTLTIQNQLKNISVINASKKIDSRIFNVVEAIIPPEPNSVQVSNLVVDADAGIITIDGQAASNYAALEVFQKTIESAKVKFTDASKTKQEVNLATDMSTSNTNYGQDTSGAMVLRFTISFVYAPELFSPASQGVSVSIPTIGNATDSYLGVPKSIFVEPAKDVTTGTGGQ